MLSHFLILCIAVLSRVWSSVILVRQGPRHPQIYLVQLHGTTEYRLPTFLERRRPTNDPIKGLVEVLGFDFSAKRMHMKTVRDGDSTFFIIYSGSRQLSQEPGAHGNAQDAAWFPLHAWEENGLDLDQHWNLKAARECRAVGKALDDIFDGKNIGEIVVDNAPVPSVILRFDGFGHPQVLMACKGNGYKLPNFTPIERQEHFSPLVCGSTNNGGKGKVAVCRASLKKDGSIATARFTINRVNLEWRPVRDYAPFRQMTMEQSKAFLEKYKIHIDSRPGQTKHGFQRLVAVLKGTEAFMSSQIPLAVFLREASVTAMNQSEKLTFDPYTPPIPVVRTQYFLVRNDTFGAARTALNTNPQSHVLIVNFANNFNAGGGYKKGSSAQEEDLFRCSTLPWILGPLQNNPGFYPINQMETVKGIYSPGCHILRRRSDYAFLTEAEIRASSISVLSLAAFDRKDRSQQEAFRQGTNQFTSLGKNITMHRIRFMFQTAMNKGVDTLVVGAFGCGAFDNDPNVIVELFNGAMAEYHNTIPNIVFSIIGDRNYGAFQRGLRFPDRPI